MISTSAASITSSTCGSPVASTRTPRRCSSARPSRGRGRWPRTGGADHQGVARAEVGGEPGRVEAVDVAAAPVVAAGRRVQHDGVLRRDACHSRKTGPVPGAGPHQGVVAGAAGARRGEVAGVGPLPDALGVQVGDQAVDPAVGAAQHLRYVDAVPGAGLVQQVGARVLSGVPWWVWMWTLPGRLRTAPGPVDVVDEVRGPLGDPAVGRAAEEDVLHVHREQRHLLLVLEHPHPRACRGDRAGRVVDRRRGRRARPGGRRPSTPRGPGPAAGRPAPPTGRGPASRPPPYGPGAPGAPARGWPGSCTCGPGRRR
ncbi:hypothetical protein SFUMM280S_09472 [Streptomyces fumanus]